MITTLLATVLAQSLTAPLTDQTYDPYPQVLPTSFYASEIYRYRTKYFTNPQIEDQTPPPADEEEEEEGGSKGIPEGFGATSINETPVLWPLGQASIEFTPTANYVMTAYGYHYWGKYFKQPTWQNRSIIMANLWAVAPNLATTSFDPTTKTFSAEQSQSAASTSAFFALLMNPNPSEAKSITKLKNASTSPSLSPSSANWTPQTALYHLTLLQTSANKSEIQSKINAYKWPNPQDVTPTDLPWLLLARSAQAKQSKDKEALRQVTLTANALLNHQVKNSSLPTMNANGGFSFNGALVHSDTAIAAMALCDAGAVTQNVDLFKQGVRALRVSLGLINYAAAPTNSPLNPAKPRHLAYSAYSKTKTDIFEPWISYESCEGKILAAAAYITERYGAAYELTPNQWVGVDTLAPAPNKPGKFFNLLAGAPLPFGTPSLYQFIVTNTGARQDLSQTFELQPTPSTAQISEIKGDQATITVSPGFSSNQPVSQSTTATYTIANQTKPLIVSPEGYTITIPINELLNAPVSVTFQHQGLSLTRLFNIIPNPLQNINNPRLWQSTGNLTSKSLSTGTESNPHGYGTIDSAPFTTSPGILAFQLQGTGDAYLQLIEAQSGAVLLEYQPTENQKESLEWDLSLVPNQRVFIRLLDPYGDAYITINKLEVKPATPFPPTR